MKRTIALAAGFAATIFGSQAPAADLPKEGTYDFMSCFSGTVNAIGFSKTHSANTMGPFGALKPGTIQNCSRQKGAYKLK